MSELKLEYLNFYSIKHIWKCCLQTAFCSSLNMFTYQSATRCQQWDISPPLQCSGTIPRLHGSVAPQLQTYVIWWPNKAGLLIDLKCSDAEGQNDSKHILIAVTIICEIVCSCRKEYFNRQIYFRIQNNIFVFLPTDRMQVTAIPPRDRQGSSCSIKSSVWLLMTSRHME